MSVLCLAKDLVTVQSPFGSFPWKSYQIKSRGYALTRSTLLRFFALTTIVGSILILKSYSLVFSIPIASWFTYSRRRISVWQISLRTRYFSISNLFTLQAHQSCITSVFVNNTIVTNQWVYRRDQFIFAVRTSFLWPSQPNYTAPLPVCVFGRSARHLTKTEIASDLNSLSQTFNTHSALRLYKSVAFPLWVLTIHTVPSRFKYKSTVRVNSLTTIYHRRSESIFHFTRRANSTKSSLSTICANLIGKDISNVDWPHSVLCFWGRVSHRVASVIWNRKRYQTTVGRHLHCRSECCFLVILTVATQDTVEDIIVHSYIIVIIQERRRQNYHQVIAIRTTLHLYSFWNSYVLMISSQ